MISPTSAEYVDAILKVAAGDVSIARALREICALDGAVRASALDLMAAHLRARAVAADILECVAALRRDDVARRIAEALARPAP
ncbi:MAG: hypothetical protein ACREJV_06590 [Candidatus Rokuibacteriota bacterium]